MNINANISITKTDSADKSKSTPQESAGSGFADELKELEKGQKKEKSDKTPEAKNTEIKSDKNVESRKKSSEEVNPKWAINDLTSVIDKLNQSEDKLNSSLKKTLIYTVKNNDNENKGEILINNDFNVSEMKDKLPQMNPNMNFGGDGQPFSSFMNNESSPNGEKSLALNAKDIEEEAAILSTMAENTAIANKMNLNSQQENSEKTVQRNDGIKKIDTKSGITKETIVKYDTVIMNEADVEVFTNLVTKGEVNMNNLAPEAMQKSVHVSKTLADMLAKAMEDNKPVRIEFDNGISVIIKISRDGKLTADFLPSTQIAEAYLKENLPLLKQRFDEQNIEYNELNQRERRNNNKEQQRKKGSDNE